MLPMHIDTVIESDFVVGCRVQTRSIVAVGRMQGKDTKLSFHAFQPTRARFHWDTNVEGRTCGQQDLTEQKCYWCITASGQAVHITVFVYDKVAPAAVHRSCH